MFEIKNVSKSYGDEIAIKNISMKIGKGLNFIVGSSGSGKTTLLKIISSMDDLYDGDVLYCEESMKSLTDEEKSYYYNNVFGFVWQDFNLLEDLTVLENVMLPQYIKKGQDKNTVMKVLKELNINKLANQKCSELSGGQKQRVAIARELIKEPLVIIADEPTSALDEKTSKKIIDILRDISKNRTVIVVTHDTSLIDGKSNIYEIDKGELISAPKEIQSNSDKANMENNHKLSFYNAFKLGFQNTKRRLGKFATTVLSLCIATILLLITINGAIVESGQSEFDELLNTYGDGLLDIKLYNSFIDASGSSGTENDKQSGDVTQEIGGLYDFYAKDTRVELISYMVAFSNIKIELDEEEYYINNSGNSTTINELIAGNMPLGNGNEVVVPESFSSILGISPEETIGKEITFYGEITDWSSGEPIFKKTSTNAKIVGVMDTTVKYDYLGEIMEFVVEDSFLFSKTALLELHEKVGKPTDEMGVLIRAKTPWDMIAIKNELNKQGIVPIGRFELVEDIVRLNMQREEQSKSANIVITVLAIIIILVISIITAIIRKREYAIYKISGYANKHLLIMTAMEILIATMTSAFLFISTSPFTNFLLTALWDVNILNIKSLIVGILLLFILGVFYSIITTIISVRTNISISLKTGGK